MTLAFFKVLVFWLSLTFTSLTFCQLMTGLIAKKGTAHFIYPIIGWTIFYALYVFGG